MIKQAKNLCKGDVIYLVEQKVAATVVAVYPHWNKDSIQLAEVLSFRGVYGTTQTNVVRFKNNFCIPVIAQSEVHRDINRS
jgi:hypothetical protein